MCGIFAAIRTDGFFDGAAFGQFVRSTDMVRFRGPDDSGYLALNVKQAPAADTSTRFDVYLGSRRLAILDLSANGHQPMTDHQGRWIVFNGEIFNYVELRRELELKGHRFTTQTDTEVILHIYAEYGETGFNKLNGMWAFAIADLPRRRVVLSRDRFSIKPLHVLVQPGTFYFASEIKQLIPLLPRKHPNLEVLAAFLGQGLLDHSRETFFAGITRVPPRTNLVISMDTGQVLETRYWDFAPAEDAAPASDATERFRELFLDAVKIRLRSDVKVSVLLSGGLDSSAIAVATRLDGANALETYSIVSEERKYSEDKYIDLLAAAGMSNRKVPFRSSDALENLRTAIYHSDEPFGGLSVFAQYKLFHAIKQNSDATVLLSGQGGDEVLLGYSKFFYFYLRNLLRQHRFCTAAWQIVTSLLQRTVVRQFQFREARRYIGSLRNATRRVFPRSYDPIPIWDCRDLRSRQIADIEQYSIPALTHHEDRNSMAQSLEVRHPFLDHRLVDFVVNLPSDMKIRNGWTKYILRQSLPELPPAIRWRRDKQAFITPEELWLKNDFGGFIQQAFRDSKLADMGVLNANAFLDFYQEFRKGGQVSPMEITRTVMAEMWARDMFQ